MAGNDMDVAAAATGGHNAMLRELGTTEVLTQDPKALAEELAGSAVVCSVSEASLRRAAADLPEVEAATPLLATVDDFIVQDSISFANAGEQFLLLKRAATAIETLRKEAKAPLLEGAKLLDDTMHSIGQPFAVAAKVIDRKIVTWRQAEEVLAQQARDADVAQAQAQAEAAAALAKVRGEPEPPAVEQYIGPPPKTVDAPSGQVTVKTRKTYEIVDPMLVPRAFCVPSPGLIYAAVQAGVQSIPGVRIYAVDSTAGRPR